MKLLAIDGNSVLNRAFYGIRPLTTKEGIHTNAIFGFLNILIKLEREIAPTATAIAFDVSRKTFRNDRYELYKATRKGMPEELAQQLPLIKEVLTLMGYLVLGCDGFEGDDILGTLSHNCGCECVVATGDRDCLQLINDNVSICLLKNVGNVIYDKQAVLDEFGVSPCQIVDLKALMGDASDNIPGVKGVGEKTAVALITAHGTIEKMYAEIDTVNATPRIKGLLLTHKDDAFMSYELATICTSAPVDTDPSAYVKRPPNCEQLSNLLKKLEMFSFFSKLSLNGPSESESDNVETTTIKCEILESQTALQVAEAIGDKTSVFMTLSDKQLCVNVDNTIYCCKGEEVDMLLSIVAADASKSLYTFKAKPLIKRIKSLGFDGVKIAFDTELAAYLLNPDSKSYGDLAIRYLDGVNFSADESYLEIKSLPLLCGVLQKQLQENGMIKLYGDIELPLCEVLADMEVEGIRVDKAGVIAFGEQLSTAIAIVKASIFDLAGEEFNINSTKELATILFEKLGLPAKKKTKTGYSTNVDVLEELYTKHEIIPQILDYRKLAKLLSTYVVGLVKVIGDDGRIHTTFNQTETRTGRISSIEPNLQNIPVRTKLGSEMRRFFLAREGYTLVDADYSQIELRILAHISDDKSMINAFLAGDDIHSITASQVFHCPLDQMTSTIRSRAKAINFGIVYGISPFSLSKDISVTVAEAKAYIQAYFDTYSGVSRYMGEIVEQAKKDEFVSTLYGRKRPLADINNSNKLISGFAKRVALNAPIQGTAADIIKLAMVKVHARLKAEKVDARLILQVHDELIIEAPFMQADMVKAMLKEEMQNAASLAVPLLVDVHIGENWYQAKGM